MIRTATIAILLLALTGVATASTLDGRRFPESSCAFDPATATLTVVGANTRTVVKRTGDEIAVAQSGTGRRTCSTPGPAPTVTGVDLIRVEATDGALVTLDLRGGPLAPGATDEGDGSSEIEVEADLDFADLEIHGSAGADRIAAGTVSARPAVNLNAEEAGADADVTFSGGGAAVLSIAGKGGDDEVTAGGGPGFSGGFRGELAANTGAGDDVLTGSPGSDSLKAGGGADRVRALGGSDSIYTRDGTADRVACGPGADTAGADREDRLSGCERVGR